MIQRVLAHIRNKKMERNRKEKAFRSRQIQSHSASVFQSPVGRKAGQVPVQGNKDKKRTSGQIEHLKAFFKASFRKGM